MSASYPTPWTFEAEDEFENTPIRAANGEYVLVRDSGVYPPDLDTCREIVEAVNGRKRDEVLIASLLYHHLEDFAEAVASDGFTQVIKAAFRRLGLKYEPFGLDALEAVEQHMKEGGEKWNSALD